jgi:serine/threonine-protein kinase
MERLPGGTLADEIEREGPLPEARVRTILDGVLAALATAHAAGVLHRDVKPGNILITPDGRVKLTDFGLAKTAGTAHTMTGQIAGTVGYVSPERLHGAAATVTDDIYAVGVVGYEALAGRHAFTGDNIAAIAHAILHDDPTPLRTLRPGVDAHLVTVIERAMARDPQQRFASAADMRAALGNQHPLAPPAPLRRPSTKVLNGAPVPAPHIVPMPAVHRPFAPAGVGTGMKRVFAAVAVLVALALTSVAFVFDSSTSPPAPKPASTNAPTTPPISVTPPPPSPPTEATIEQVTDRDQGPPPGKGKGPKPGKGPKR